MSFSGSEFRYLPTPSSAPLYQDQRHIPHQQNFTEDPKSALLRQENSQVLNSLHHQQESSSIDVTLDDVIEVLKLRPEAFSAADVANFQRCLPSENPNLSPSLQAKRESKVWNLDNVGIPDPEEYQMRENKDESFDLFAEICDMKPTIDPSFCYTDQEFSTAHVRLDTVATSRIPANHFVVGGNSQTHCQDQQSMEDPSLGSRSGPDSLESENTDVRLRARGLFEFPAVAGAPGMGDLPNLVSGDVSLKFDLARKAGMSVPLSKGCSTCTESTTVGSSGSIATDCADPVLVKLPENIFEGLIELPSDVERMHLAGFDQTRFGMLPESPGPEKSAPNPMSLSPSPSQHTAPHNGDGMMDSPRSSCNSFASSPSSTQELNQTFSDGQERCDKESFVSTDRSLMVDEVRKENDHRRKRPTLSPDWMGTSVARDVMQGPCLWEIDNNVPRKKIRLDGAESPSSSNGFRIGYQTPAGQSKNAARGPSLPRGRQSQPCCTEVAVRAVPQRKGTAVEPVVPPDLACRYDVKNKLSNSIRSRRAQSGQEPMNFGPEPQRTYELTEEELMKIEKRRKRNRESARATRENQKQTMKNLEEKVKMLERQGKAKSDEIVALTTKLSEFQRALDEHVCLRR